MSSIWAWLATRAASGWIAAVAAALIGLGVWQIQQLRVEAAQCKGRLSVQGQLDKLTERVVEQIEDETDETLDRIEDLADDGCLDRVVPDGVREPAKD